ncbi:MAG TPA: hypothetical protein PKY29_04300 [Ferruginibacter sp.]|nr:hypothetical protein [Ferruginibacter sp.]HRQ20509.1 hypothetical protein [Ferruginibacter sp.]
MKLTKDEAAVLCQALYEQKYELNERVIDYAKQIGKSSMSAFEDLEKRLSEFSNDRRRNGRSSQNSFHDILKRFVSRYIKL